MKRIRIHLLLAAATATMFALANWRSPLLNEDSVLYLVLAERIAEQGFAAGFALFDRPFYSALIAVLHGGLDLPVLAAARLLNGTCAVLLVLAFAEFCRLLHRDDRLLPWAGLLLLAHPKFVNSMPLLVRDLGYWALLLTAACALLRHLRDDSLRWLPAWAACVLGAGVFKPEAAVWGVCLAIGLLFIPGAGLQRRAVRAGVALLSFGLPVGLVLVAYQLRYAGTSAAPDLLAVPREITSAVIEGFSGAVDRYATQVLDPFSRHVAGLSLAGGLLAILVAKILNATGPLQLLALLTGRAAAPPMRGALLALAVPALLLPAVFVAFRQFLDTRYVMMAVLLLLALVVPRVRELALRAGSASPRRHAWAIGLVVALFVLDLGLGLDRPKDYMLRGVAWMRAELGPQTRIFSNDVQLAAASGARWDWNEVRGSAAWLQAGRIPDTAEVLVLHERADREAIPPTAAPALARFAAVTEFAGERGERIRILRRSRADAPP